MYVCMHVHEPITWAATREDIYPHGGIGPPVGTRVRRLDVCHCPDPLLAAAWSSVPCPGRCASPGASYPCRSRSPATWPPCPCSPPSRRAACLGPVSWGAETDRLEACHAHEAAAAMLPAQGPKARQWDQLPSTGEQRRGGKRARAPQPGGRPPGSPIWRDHGSRSPANGEARASQPNPTIRWSSPVAAWVEGERERPTLYGPNRSPDPLPYKIRPPRIEFGTGNVCTHDERPSESGGSM